MSLPVPTPPPSSARTPGAPGARRRSLSARLLEAVGWAAATGDAGADADDGRSGQRVGFADIGGLATEVARVREMVEYPLRHPEIFAHLGVEPPKGILLYGPPGCGKTLIARAVAHETGAHFINVNSPEIIQKHYGESEELLRQLFAEARKYPATILFFDEIDALAPNRETVLGDVEKRVVAQLLALLDGLHSRGQVIVLAATNLPNNVDPALRRPGRFDREIGINPPDRAGRLEILKIHTRRMPLAPDVELERIAARTHGFLGADLAALCREAALRCTRDHQSRPATSAAPALAGLRVRLAHFDSALAELDLSSVRQMTTEMPASGWDRVGGLAEPKRQLREAVEWPLKYSARFAHAGTGAPKGIRLTGAPGTGKTLLARAVASESETNFICVKGPELLSKWVGESERGIREVFRRARQSAPCILFFDEIDALVPARSGCDAGTGALDRIVGQFLLEMDNLEEHPALVVLAATNRPGLLDPALLRPGRFDLRIALPLPTAAERREILQIHCAASPLDRELDLDALARETDGLSGADLEALCKRAAMLAIRDSIAAYPGAEFPPFRIGARHFAAARAETRAAVAGP